MVVSPPIDDRVKEDGVVEESDDSAITVDESTDEGTVPVNQSNENNNSLLETVEIATDDNDPTKSETTVDDLLVSIDESIASGAGNLNQSAEDDDDAGDDDDGGDDGDDGSDDDDADDDDEGEEDEVVDPREEIKDRCARTLDCKPLKKKLDDCNDRLDQGLYCDMRVSKDVPNVVLF